MTDMSNRPEAHTTAVLYRMVMPHHVCPYGLKAKHLLERSGYRVEDRHLSTREETDAFKAQHQVATTPQVFIGGSGSAAMTTFGASSASASRTRRRPPTARSPRCSR